MRVSVCVQGCCGRVCDALIGAAVCWTVSTSPEIFEFSVELLKNADLQRSI